MNIFVIVIEFFVNLKNNFQNWIKPNIIYFLHYFTTETRKFAEACLLQLATLISHYLLVIGPSLSYTFIMSCNWLNMIEILHCTFRLYILQWYLYAHYILKFNPGAKKFKLLISFYCNINNVLL